MSLWIAEGKLYQDQPDGTILNMGMTAKDKVVEVRELESTTLVAGDKVASLPEGAQKATYAEVIARFNVSEKNPIAVAKKAPAKRGKAAEKTEE